MANRAYKGRTFEIWLAQKLSLWWSGGERDDIFWHTHDSGGRATRRAAKGKTTTGLYGDICAVDPCGAPLIKLLTIEAKKGYGHLSLQDLLDLPAGKKGGNAGENWTDWLAKARRDHEAAGSHSWLMVVRRDRREPLVVVTDRLVMELTAERMGVDRGDETTPSIRLYIPLGGYTVYLWAFTLEDFLSEVTPENVKALLKRCLHMAGREIAAP